MDSEIHADAAKRIPTRVEECTESKTQEGIHISMEQLQDAERGETRNEPERYIKRKSTEQKCEEDEA